MSFRILLSICGLTFLCSQGIIYAQDEAVEVIIPRLQGEIVFDGFPDEAAWDYIDPFKMVTHSPVFGNQPKERTIIKAAYDDEYLYFSACMYISDPENIQALTKLRDDKCDDSDVLGILLDTYNDKRNAGLFMVTPEGTRTDMSIFNDAKPYYKDDPPFNISWNTFWDVKTMVTGEAWFAEVRVPVSSLRFQDVDDEVTMGLIVFRKLPARKETYIYPAIPNTFGEWSHMKVSLAQPVVFHGLRPRKPFYVTPYVSAGLKNQNELNEAENSYEFKSKKDLNGGLDLKFGLASNFAMDVTINTDFSTVEADDEKVNLTRFDLYYEEKRQFFLERASLLDFRTGGPTTMFYSRRIGLDDDFNTVPIIGGVRITGRTGPNDIGFLNLQTARSDSLPSENFGVLRLKRKIFNQNSHIGSVLTSRIGMDGSFNEVYGIDALVNLKGDDYLDVKFGQSFETGKANVPFAFDNMRYHVGVDRRRNVGLIYTIILGGAGHEYNPGIGYQDRVGFHAQHGGLKYRWLAGEKSPVFMHGPQLKHTFFYNPEQSKMETIRTTFEYGLGLKTDWRFRAGFTRYDDNIFEEYDISDEVVVPIGSYDYITWLADVKTPLQNRASIAMKIEAGTFFDGFSNTITLEPFWSLSSSLRLSGAYIYNQVDFNERNQHFKCHIARIKALAMFSTSLSLNAYIQYNTTINTFYSNIRLRLNPREGNDLYLVYNYGANTHLDRMDAYTIPRLDIQTIMLKYNYTFRL